MKKGCLQHSGVEAAFYVLFSGQMIFKYRKTFSIFKQRETTITPRAPVFLCCDLLSF